MKSLIVILKPVVFYLFATTSSQGSSSSTSDTPKVRYQENLKGTNIFYIDGYNVLGHAGTANHSTTLTSKLSQVTDPRSNTIILVFDGPKFTKSSSSSSSVSSPSTIIPVDEVTASIESSPSTSQTPPTLTDNTNNPVVETTIEILNTYGTFQKVTLGTGMLADDYILNEIRAMEHTNRHNPTTTTTTSSLSTSRNVVQVVTADRKLRQQVLAIKPNKVKGVINPVTFWKRYVPRLCGLKNK